jgi:hypothetical protein
VEKIETIKATKQVSADSIQNSFEKLKHFELDFSTKSVKQAYIHDS